MNIFSQKNDKNKPDPEQTCLFCNRKDAEMPVYSCCLGRLGICLDCADKARTALLEHQEQRKIRQGKEANHENI